MKTLYDTTTAKLTPYPRSDDEPVVGLDPIYETLDVLEQPKPELQENEYLESTQVIDLDARTVTRGWLIRSLPTTPPHWANAQALLAAFTGEEIAAMALSVHPAVAGLRFKVSTWLDIIHADNTEVQGGFDLLVQQGIISSARRAEILSSLI